MASNTNESKERVLGYFKYMKENNGRCPPGVFMFVSGSPEEDEWEDVCNAGEANKNAKPQLFKDVKGDLWPQYNDFKYYQTYGGGPEGGYITDGTILAKVHRDWGVPFSVKVVNGTLVFRPGDDKKGRPNQVKVTLSE